MIEHEVHDARHATGPGDPDHHQGDTSIKTYLTCVSSICAVFAVVLLCRTWYDTWESDLYSVSTRFHASRELTDWRYLELLGITSLGFGLAILKPDGAHDGTPKWMRIVAVCVHVLVGAVAVVHFF